MKLWLDDIRPMPEDYNVLAKSADEAIKILGSGKITHVSFDHDLGDVEPTDGLIVTWAEHEKTGYDVAVWIEEQSALGNIKHLTYSIHSANPIGSARIDVAMRRASRYWDN